MLISLKKAEKYQKETATRYDFDHGYVKVQMSYTAV